FSVMEYWEDSTLLHDFVYATVDTSDPRMRERTEEFFKDYRVAKGRDGSYLLGADIANPLWEATFMSPAEMRVHKAAQLKLIEARVEEAVHGEGTTTALVHRLARLDDAEDLKRLSADAGIDWRRWFEGRGRIGEQADRLVAEAIRLNRQQALL